MARTTFGGYGITELRNIAREIGIKAVVDVAAAETEAYREDSRRRVAAARQGHPAALDGTLGGPEMILAILPAAIEQAHSQALDEAAERAPAHIRTNCPALKVGGCMKCTAPATVRAAQGDDSAYQPTLAELEQPVPCGQRWVAEIQRCPRCGLHAAAHV